MEARGDSAHRRVTVGSADGRKLATGLSANEAANGWQEVTVTLAALGVANKPDLDGFWIQDSSGTAQPELTPAASAWLFANSENRATSDWCRTNTGWRV